MMPPVEFGPAIPTSERLLTHTFDGAVTDIGALVKYALKSWKLNPLNKKKNPVFF
jgi:hypothetical protein